MLNEEYYFPLTSPYDVINAEDRIYGIQILYICISFDGNNRFYYYVLRRQIQLEF